MSYSGTGFGWVAQAIDAGLQLTDQTMAAASGKHKKAARTARNVEAGARLSLEAAQAQAAGTQRAGQIAAEGQVSAVAERLRLEAKAAEKRQRTILIGSAAAVGVLGLIFVAYRIVRS